MIETTPIFDRVAASVPHSFDALSRRGICRWCGKTARARIHIREIR